MSAAAGSHLHERLEQCWAFCACGLKTYIRCAVLEQVLSAPATAAHAAAAGSGKRRVELEAAIVAAVGTALHWLGALKQVCLLTLPICTLTGKSFGCSSIGSDGV